MARVITVPTSYFKSNAFRCLKALYLKKILRNVESEENLGYRDLSLQLYSNEDNKIIVIKEYSKTLI